MDLTALEAKLGVKFWNIELLMRALTHKSFLKEERSWRLGHNERFNFLGDALILAMVSAHLVTTKQEGNLTQARTVIISKEVLFAIAKDLGVHEHVQMSKSFTDGPEQGRVGIVADAFRAILGALFIDQGGYDVPDDFVSRHILAGAIDLIKGRRQDPKTALQEKTQPKLGLQPRYKVLGPRERNTKQCLKLGSILVMS